MSDDTKTGKTVWTSRNRSKWHWIALIGAIAIGCVTSGMMQNASGITIVPMSEFFGIGRGEGALYLTVMGLVMGVMFLFVGFIMDKVKSMIWIPLGMAAAVVGFVLPYFATSIGNMYVAAIFMAITGALCGGAFMCGVGANWFEKGAGTVIGVINAVTTGVGAIWSTLGSWVIESYGWQNAFLVEAVLAAILLILAIPLFRYRPSEKGLIPYGAKEEDYIKKSEQSETIEIPGVTWKRAVKSPVFWFVAIFAFLTMAINAMSANLPGLATSAGMSTTVSGLVGSVSLIGWVIGSIVVGGLVDKWGMFRATIFLGIFGIVGCALIILVHHDVAIFAGSFLFGLPMGLPMVGTSVAAQRYFGGKNFGTISCWINAVLAFSYYGFVSIYSFIYDASGSYTPGIILCICFLVCAVIVIRIIMATGERLRREWAK